MSRTKRGSVPKLRKHASGQAVVRLCGKEIYCGLHGTAKSRERYFRAIAEWEANGRKQPPVLGKPVKNEDRGLSVDEVLYECLTRELPIRYAKHGRPTGEADNVKRALRPLRKYYATLSRTTSGLSL